MKRILLLAIVFSSCTVDPKMLVGNWQAVDYFEMGQSINTPLDSVQLSFSNTGNYTFRSIGLYEEEGQYRVGGKYLFLRDMTIQHPKEKAYKIQFIAADSLKIGMEADGKARTVFFGRIR